MSPPTLEDDVSAWAAIEGAKAKLGTIKADESTNKHIVDAVRSLERAKAEITTRRQKTRSVKA